jgi:hypothetical protein
MRSITFITIVAATAALSLPAAAQAGSAAVLRIDGVSPRAPVGTEQVTHVRANRRVVLAGTVRSVSRRVLTLTLEDGAELEIGVDSLVRGRRGRRLLRTLRPGDRLLAVVRFRRDGSMRVRLVPLPAPGGDGPGYDPGDYDGGDYDGGDYDGGDYDGGDYVPGEPDSKPQENHGGSGD